eukprot:scaffold49071_cov54-Attheya_sp.AAC.7
MTKTSPKTVIIIVDGAIMLLIQHQSKSSLKPNDKPVSILMPVLMHLLFKISNVSPWFHLLLAAATVSDLLPSLNNNVSASSYIHRMMPSVNPSTNKAAYIYYSGVPNVLPAPAGVLDNKAWNITQPKE